MHEYMHTVDCVILYISDSNVMYCISRHFLHSMFVVGVNFRSDKYTVGEGDGSVTVTVDASKEHADFSFVIEVVPREDTADSM